MTETPDTPGDPTHRTRNRTGFGHPGQSLTLRQTDQNAKPQVLGILPIRGGQA